MHTEHEQAINESGREKLFEGIKWHIGQLKRKCHASLKVTHLQLCSRRTKRFQNNESEQDAI